MKTRQRIFVHGRTVILAGIEASINLDPDYEIVGRALPLDPKELSALRPDVVIFELDAAKPDLGCNLAHELPGLLFIGIDPENNRTLLWSGWEAKALSSQDLTQVIHDRGVAIAAKEMKAGKYEVKA